MSGPPPACKTGNWPACNEALKRGGALTIRFDPEMMWEASPAGVADSPPIVTPRSGHA